MSCTRRFVVAVAVAGLLAPSLASAQEASESSEGVFEDDFEFDIEVPTIVEIDGPAAGGVDEELDLANVVQSAAKGITTVQEAPTIVTVITADDFNEKGYQNLEDILDTVPGFLRFDALNNQFPFALARGTAQAALYLHNGMSLFEPAINVPLFSRVTPVEIIKRIETITGPGGVLWGANSYQGLINVITKDAADVEGGLEAGFRAGTGNGDRDLVRGYVMSGVTDLLDAGIDVFTHFSVESYAGPRYQLPTHIFSSPTPAPNSPVVYGGYVASDQPRSTIFNLDGKIDIGKLTISYFYPFGERQVPLGFPGSVVREELPEDTLVNADGELQCSPVDPRLANGQPNPEAFAGGDGCSDRGRVARRSEQNFFDRYITAAYETRFADNRAGAKLQVYGIQFVRDFQQLQVFSPSSLLETGLAIGLDQSSFRFGANYDGDVELPGDIRVLYGGEVARSLYTDNQEGSIQGPGRQANIFAPLDLNRTNSPCPIMPDPDNMGLTLFVPNCPLTGGFEADRTILGAYVNPQWKPFKNLTFDGGVRVQSAPNALSDSDLGYDTQLLFSGAAVLNFLRDWHLKINYAEGFRPPVFNNVQSNGAGIQVEGDPTLEVETSQAIQGEVNARLFKGKNQIREFNFRADYSYSRLENLIQIVGGRYVNEAPRGIHSAEFLGKMYLQGGHRVELSYTWLLINSELRGRLKTLPEHWFNIAGVFNLIDGRLLATTTLRIRGAMEDANRIVEYRDVDELGENGFATQVSTDAHDILLDRLPPSANLQAGLMFRASDSITFTANAFNAFNSRFFQPDAFSDFEPRFEFLPNPYQDFRFTVGMVVNAPQ